VLRLKVTKTSTQRDASRFRVTTRATGALVPLRKVRGAFVAPLLDNGGTEIVITYSTLAEHGDQLPRAPPRSIFPSSNGELSLRKERAHATLA